METFVPLYISNYCDSHCLMCNFNHENKNLIRKTATEQEITEQLKIIRDYEKITAVCLLTGEVFGEEKRMKNLILICNSINQALSLGFEQIFFNIGSLSYKEIAFLKENITDCSKIVLSLFQETYEKQAYAHYFGLSSENNPKANYQNRIDTISRWLDAGFRMIDIGVLLGFKPINDDIIQLIAYAKEYHHRNAEVYISTPRIKNGCVQDKEYLCTLHQLHNELPWAKLIVTTRESITFINENIDIFSVVSPGSSDICPYNKGEFISNHQATSQFFIDEKRMRPYTVLTSLQYYNSIRFFNRQAE